MMNALQSKTNFPLRSALSGRPRILPLRRNLNLKREVSKYRVTKATPSDCFVLDFDGVLIDSEPEVSASALHASKKRWPEIFSSLSADQEKRLAADLRSVRPVLIKGFESMVMARMLREEGSAVDAILANWPAQLESCIARWGEQADGLADMYEGLRQQWMSERPDEWQGLQRAYPGVVEAMKGCAFPCYIASSKAAHRISPLLKKRLGMDVPPDSPQLFAGLLPPDEKKLEALRSISQRPLVAQGGATMHFVDDRLETLKCVAGSTDLANVRLYLAGWGYNTAAEREAAAGVKGVQVLDLAQFKELLRWGLVMGVDDGCQEADDEE